MIWENIDGKIVFKDGQTNAVYDNFVDTILSNVNLHKPTEILRTDNLQINTSEIKKYINSDTVFKTYVDHGGEVAVKVATGPVGQVALASAATVGYVKLNTNIAVNNYKKQYPNTKLSDKEIVKLLSHN